MSNGTADRITLNAAGQTTLRMLIASYFLAVALGIIPGTDLGLLFAPVLPAPIAAAVAAAAVFLLSFMVMTAIHTRVAALILGLMTFYASYLTMMELGVDRELGAFWRDLALIAALLLTYSDNPAGLRSRRGPIHRHVSPRRVMAPLESATPRLAFPNGAPATAVAAPQDDMIARRSRTARPGPAPADTREIETDIINIFSDEDRSA